MKKQTKIKGYNAIIICIVLAILVVANIFVGLLPTKATQFDISSQQLYTLTSNSKSLLNNLSEDVTIYWICQSGEEDDVVEKILDVYENSSDHITIDKKNPDIYPTFAEQYTSSTVYNNSLIVECGSKYRYIDFYEIYEFDTEEYYSTGSVVAYFDGEGEITSAIDYVIREDLPQVYLLSGHGETEFSEDFTNAITKDNIELQTFSLLTVDEVPEDADCVMIYAPENDISEEEAKMLTEYLSQGGKLIVYNGPKETGTLTNLSSVLNNYGVEFTDGIVVEADRNHYAFSAPYVLLPDIAEDEITTEFVDNGSYIILPIAQGMNVTSSVSGVTVTSLLDTSSDSFSKIDGYELTTYDKESDDIDGPFSVGLKIEDENTGAQIIWVSSDLVLEDMYNSYSAGANYNFALNNISWMVGETESISIRTKSLDYNYLTIPESQAGMIKVVLLGIIPLCFLLLGIFEKIDRRKLK